MVESSRPLSPPPSTMTTQEVLKELEASFGEHLKDDLRCFAEAGHLTEEQYGALVDAWLKDRFQITVTLN